MGLLKWSGLKYYISILSAPRFTLLLFFRCKSAVKHYMMSLTKNRIVFGQEQFKNVDSLLKHFSNCPVVGDDEGQRRNRSKSHNCLV